MKNMDDKKLEKFDKTARALLALHSEGLTSNRKKGYVVLERKLAKSDANKNAVSVIREGIVFMVPDWSDQPTANRLMLDPKPSTKFELRLVLKHMDETQIAQNSEFLTQLIVKAKAKSESLQATEKEK